MPAVDCINEDCLWLSTVSVAMAGAHGARSKRPTLPLDSFFHFGCGIQPETCLLHGIYDRYLLHGVALILRKFVDNLCKVCKGCGQGNIGYNNGFKMKSFPLTGKALLHLMPLLKTCEEFRIVKSDIVDKKRLHNGSLPFLLYTPAFAPARLGPRANGNPLFSICSPVFPGWPGIAV